MPFLYLVGIIQSLSQTILGFNFILVIFGVALSKINRMKILVLSLSAVQLALAYVFFIQTEITLKRYLLMPSVLLIPWVGYGITCILKIVSKLAYTNIVVGCIVIVIIGIPVSKFNHFFIKYDDLAGQAGAWIEKQEVLKNAKIVFNDQIVMYYVNSKRDGGTNFILQIVPKDLSALLKCANDNNADVIVIQQRRSEFLTDLQITNC